MTEQQHDGPPSARQLDHPAGHALADLASIFEELKIVLGCCEQLLTEIGKGAEANLATIEGLWTTALLSYQRCFNEGKRGQGLTEKDLAETGLEGEIVDWHRMLGKMRDHYAHKASNPREQFTVGVTQDADGQPNGIAIMSTVSPQLDELTVRQTGGIAYALSQIVDARIKAQQEVVLAAAKKMSAAELRKLPEVELTTGE